VQARESEPPRPGLTVSAKDDADLVQAALDGDKESLGVLIQRHWPTAIFLASKVLGSPELARDAAQEAAIAVLIGLGRLRSPDRFGAWFCGITLNVSRRWLRQRGRELPGIAPDQASDLPGPAEAAEAADIAARVRTAIDSLAGGQAAAVRLFYLQGLSHREVAAELRISPGAVKARLHQARAALAVKLAPAIDITEGDTMTTTEPASQPTWLDATVTEIRLAPGQDEAGHHIMVLSAANERLTLPIWIGGAEATALALTLESAEMPRPFTYQLATDLVAASGARIEEVRITRLVPPVFYATVLVSGAAGSHEVDARPSDAVNLALVNGAPIRVERALFDVVPPRALDLASLPVVTANIAAREAARLQEALDPPEEAEP
jgi:RNA polymerase sigma factor (sigma-70 family)